MNTLVQDLRLAVRGWRRNPGFVLVAVLSLAIGIGASTAIFSVAKALFLEPLPYRDADRLVILWNRSPGLNIAEDWFSTAQYFDIRSSHQGFEEIAIALGAYANLTGEREPERIGTIRVSSNLLPMLGARPLLGRLFTRQEDAPGRTPVAVLSYGAWMRRYGGDRGVLGKKIQLNGQPFEIVGVLPEGLDVPREVMPTLGVVEQSDLFVPLPLPEAARTLRTHEDYNILAKLKPGVTVRAAQAEMEPITARLRNDHPQIYPPNGGLTFSVVPLQDQVTGAARRPVAILVGAVGFVLLIACANVANLQLSRAIARRREVAVRAALGASPSRILRQLMTENVALAVLGGAMGVMLAGAGIAVLRAFGAKSVPRLAAIGIDWTVLLFTLAISVVAGFVFGLGPAWRTARVDLQIDLRSGERGSTEFAARWGRGLLVAGELALAVVLLVGAGLLIRSFVRLIQVAPGFESSQVLTCELTMSGNRYREQDTVRNAYKELWRRIGSLPGVVSVGGVSALPLSNYFSWGPITVEGRVPPAGEKFINADQRMAGGRYFETMRIPLVQGRWFNEHDDRDGQRVTVVDEHMAREMWPGQDPIGKRVKPGLADSKSPWLTVVGVAGRVKQYALDTDSRIAMYLPHEQYPARAMFVTIRTRGDLTPAQLTAAVTREVRAIDPDLPVYHVRLMTDRVDESLAQRRFSMLLLGLFAGLALALALIGVYGVLAYFVTQGAREIGIRLALGSTPGGILALVVRRGLALAALGVVAGLIGSAFLTRAMSGLLFGVDPLDPFTFAAIPGLLLAAALAASLIPARRAARVDPVNSLRSE